VVAAAPAAAGVQLDLHGARILIGAALDGPGADAIRAAVGRRRIAVIADAAVAHRVAEPLGRRLGIPLEDLFRVPPGESSKSRGEWARLTDQLSAREFARDSAVVAVGGGVVGDLAGFVAATFMRGIPVVQVPTTLLAMIDSSIGGKTGLDTPAGKNMVGAFHQPILVVADPATLATLPSEQMRNGFAEAVKHAVITSEEELAWLRANAGDLLAGQSAVTRGELIERNIRIKAGIVARDEREAGVRKTLNFGHTIGHAIEAACSYTMLHGECVALGMRVESRIATILGLADRSLAERVDDALTAFAIPLRPRVAVAPDALIDATRADKKARGRTVEYALAAGIGRMVSADSGYGTRVPDSVVREAIAASF
jgi:3-dehydroquinate synthase